MNIWLPLPPPQIDASSITDDIDDSECEASRGTTFAAFSTGHNQNALPIGLLEKGLYAPKVSCEIEEFEEFCEVSAFCSLKTAVKANQMESNYAICEVCEIYASDLRSTKAYRQLHLCCDFPTILIAHFSYNGARIIWR